MTVSTDRWSCPVCNHTEHLQVVTTPIRAARRLRQVQRDRGAVHAREEQQRAQQKLRERGTQP